MAYAPEEKLDFASELEPEESNNKEDNQQDKGESKYIQMTIDDFLFD